MFGWIPILGPIVDGVVSIFRSFSDSRIVKYKVDGSVDIAAMEAANEIQIANKDDIGVRLARDLIMFPTALWCSMITWDNIMVYKFPNLVWTVSKYPPGMEYLPYAVLGFLFGITSMLIWRRGA